VTQEVDSTRDFVMKSKMMIVKKIFSQIWLYIRYESRRNWTESFYILSWLPTGTYHQNLVIPNLNKNKNKNQGLKFGPFFPRKILCIWSKSYFPGKNLTI
jgi:hypothetical protein